MKILTFIRSVWAVLHLLTSTILTGLLGYLMLAFPFRHRFFSYALKIWARWNLWISGIPLKVSGLKNMDPSRQYIIVGNHESALDIFVMFAALPPGFRMVSKIGMRKVPGVGLLMKLYLFPLINRRKSEEAVAVLNDTFRKLQEESLSLCIFPEGRRSLTPVVETFKKGAFVLAAEFGLPVLPVVLRHAGAVTPSGTLKVRPGTIYLDVLPALVPEGNSVGDRERLRLKTEECFREYLKEKNYIS